MSRNNLEAARGCSEGSQRYLVIEKGTKFKKRI